MLKLNIWTPSLSGRRPVMFYMHGGGFSFGSSYELPSHDGAQMARHHDVVQVSVNHRLNMLGFFDVAGIGGAAYEDSVNVGMTDLVTALQWVRDNIENFGGDPDRVMIYGQSGGGSKVTSLMGMSSASGLFHRASAQSGGGGNIPTREQQKELARLVMKDLGLASNDIQSLQKMEWSKLFAGSDRHHDSGRTDDDADGRSVCGIRAGHGARANQSRIGRCQGGRPDRRPPSEAHGTAAIGDPEDGYQGRQERGRCRSAVQSPSGNCFKATRPGQSEEGPLCQLMLTIYAN